MREPFNHWTTLAICALPFAAVGPAFGETRVWTLTQEKAPPRASLTYAVPETDDIFGNFQCTPGSGSVTFFLSTTSTRLKPGPRATATISVGAVRASVQGKLAPNEEAGVPSFEGRIDARHPLFKALENGKTLTVVVGPSKQSAPLAGQSGKFQEIRGGLRQTVRAAVSSSGGGPATMAP